MLRELDRATHKCFSETVRCFEPFGYGLRSHGVHCDGDGLRHSGPATVNAIVPALAQFCPVGIIPALEAPR